MEVILRRDRAVVLAGLIVIAVLAWAYTVYRAYDMAMGMPIIFQVR